MVARVASKEREHMEELYWRAAAVHVRRRRLAAAALVDHMQRSKKECKKRKDLDPFSWDVHVQRLTFSKIRGVYVGPISVSY